MGRGLLFFFPRLDGRSKDPGDPDAPHELPQSCEVLNFSGECNCFFAHQGLQYVSHSFLVSPNGSFVLYFSKWKQLCSSFIIIPIFCAQSINIRGSRKVRDLSYRFAGWRNHFVAYYLMNFIVFLNIYIYLFLESRGGRKRGREMTCERNVYWLPRTHPQPVSWPMTQACALTGNQTSDLSIPRLGLNPLSHTSRATTLQFLIGIQIYTHFFVVKRT